MRLLRSASAILALATALAGCGARTGLAVECDDGGSRACENDCGEGVQSCVARW